MKTQVQSESYHLNLQLWSALWTLTVSFHSLSSFLACKCLVPSYCSHSAVFYKRALKTNRSLPAQHQKADKSSERLVVEVFISYKSHILFQSW